MGFNIHPEDMSFNAVIDGWDNYGRSHYKIANLIFPVNSGIVRDSSNEYYLHRRFKNLFTKKLRWV